MDKEIKRQIDELSNITHKMIFAKEHKKFHQGFPRLKNVSATEISIINIVSENEDVILKDIIQKLMIPKSTLTSLIDRLERKNVLRRIISKRDRRSYGLELTEEGKLIQKEHIDFEKESYERIIMALDNYEEREEFLKLLNKITNNINLE